ncbi:uncharacterized protein LOC131643133 [Vicia villosa]|uniref:uncharacterized protein LOC131643133 n=1 Tax=Vicia villosa TaxID=3911 RepID=UPI00273CCC57|nr:uncharacterized protein LOC131643133 [Vicia villosa]
MSQQSDSSSPKKLSPTDALDSIPRTEPVNPNQVLDVAPLRMFSADDMKIKKSQTPHARRPKETVRAKDTNPSLFTSGVNLPKEGSKNVHEAITKFFTCILGEQHQVPGISVPLQTVIPEPAVVPRANIIGKSSNDDDAHMVDDDVHTPNDGLQMTEEEENDDDDVHKDNDNAYDVNEIGNTGADAGTGTPTSTCTHVVDLDNYSYNDLVAVVNPSIAKRLMTRRKGPIKSRAVSQSVYVVPTKSWSKVVPRKRKAQAIVESDSDVDVQDIPLRNKPTTNKLDASVPEVPIDNISFHYPSSVNRWKYIHHKRLALERELAQNVLENKEIMDMIHEAGLMKTVVHLPTCYEMLVKEFSVNLSKDCADRKSKDFRKLYVRGKCVTFSLTVINNFIGRSDEAQPQLEVTDNKICEVITSKQSTVAIVLGKFIHTVGTKTKFDYGTYIFDQTMKHVGSYSVKGPIAFPFVICGILLNQYPNILSENDSVCKRESAISFHYKMFQGTHVPDIVTTSVGTSKDNTPTSKAVVIAMLRETCKELESRKLTIEKLISSLEMEEGSEFTENEVGPEADDEEEEASPDDGTDEEDDVGSSSSESDD